jgi:signal transduction histidine kinase
MTFLVAILFDIIFPRGYGTGFFFLIPLIISTYVLNEKATIAIALLATLAIILGFFVSPPGDLSASIFNRLASLTILVITTCLVVVHIRDERLVYDYAKQAEEGRLYLKRVIDTIPIPILVYDAEGNPIISNPPAQALWKGRPPQPGKEIDGEVCKLGTKEKITPDEFAISRLLRGALIKDEQVDVIFSDRTQRTLLIYAAPIMGRDGSLTGGVVAYLDITEIVSLKNELQRSNEELQQFAYIASHDLKQPLGTISAFMELLGERYRGKVLDEKAQMYIEHAVNGSRQLAKLIDSVLKFSKISQDEEAFQQTDMNLTLNQVEKNLTASIEESKAIITHDALPVVYAAPQQMIHLLQNLVSNGIKFRGQDVPRINVSADRIDGYWQFSVSDNGIGIDSKYQDKMFKMFSRLHSQQEYEGTGIGLALVKRIVERHGGKVWFESEVGKGSTFYFTIPAKI